MVKVSECMVSKCSAPLVPSPVPPSYVQKVVLNTLVCRERQRKRAIGLETKYSPHSSQ